MSQESSATELEVAMLYSQALAESDDEDDVFLRALHEGVAAAKSWRDERGGQRFEWAQDQKTVNPPR